MASLTLNETPAQPGEWGFRPENITTEETPPAFVWRPQEGAVSYHLQCARSANFSSIVYETTDVRYSAHRPAQTFNSGVWFWRFRFLDGKSNTSIWSQTRQFTIAPDAKPLPLPQQEDLLGRIPQTHPRLFVRPEQLVDLRKRAQTDLKPIYDELVATCEDIMADPPPTKEPPTYPEGTVRLSEEWREIWWGNRMYTIRTLNSAATLAFTRLLGGQEHYGQKAKELLLACAQWDPKGATGYRYNDEAGMPYNYYFCRTYTFVHELLSETERKMCQNVMRIRGEEMYQHLAIDTQYLWKPYNSHSGRAWHFLGEVGTTFLNEIPQATEWVWFAMNVFGAVYPAWCDEDGGWHQGLSYWASYIQRFTWWADIMRVAMGIDAYDKPYFARGGDFPMYFQPPGTRGGGMGDLTTTRTSDQNVDLMTTLAAQAKNPYWQWYVDMHQKETPADSDARTQRLNAVGAGRSLYIAFVRGALPQVAGKAPTDLPSSKCFRGTGLAVMNSNLLDAKNNVEVIFKSSPFGSQSHGFDAQNSFSLYAFGERLLIHTGQRDIHGSDHHKNWMHHTKSTNCITVNGESQLRNSPASIGEILDFQTSSSFDYVAGEAGKAYSGRLTQFTRRILFAKPDTIVIFDILKAPEPSIFEYRLHSETEMGITGQTIHITTGNAGCLVSLLQPENLTLSQTDQFDPPPRDRIKLKEYHLTAVAKPAQEQTFVAVIRPHRAGDMPSGDVVCEQVGNGFAVTVPVKGSTLHVQLSNNGHVQATRFDTKGQKMASFERNK